MYFWKTFRTGGPGWQRCLAVGVVAWPILLLSLNELRLFQLNTDTVDLDTDVDITLELGDQEHLVVLEEQSHKEDSFLMYLETDIVGLDSERGEDHVVSCH